MARSLSSLLLFSLIGHVVYAQTPVIGGSCKIGTADVQIGGKQTQFFLKCEATSESAAGEGVWVVKSRAAASPAAATAPAVPVPQENTVPQQHPKVMRKQNAPNICEQDNNARDADSCSVSATCLQSSQETPSDYLQCDQTNMRWVRKSCQEGFIFNFEQQTCIVPKRVNGLSRQQVSGLVCTYSSCSNSNPCSSGTCNNGYCCSSSSSGSNNAIIISSGSNNNGNCNGCAASPQIITIPSTSCPNGGYSVGTCSSGYCANGYSCVSGNCCPSYNQPSISVYTCPSGASAVGTCSSGSCASGYSCVSGNCCPSTTTTNPFVCPDGTQAAGGCVNGLCGTGYTCSNGLCCVGTSTTVRCLDGSEAVGACIPSCSGNSCGQVQVSYYCGSGYTCTTGNICCAVNSCPDGGEVLGPTVNGLCPAGYTAQGSVCCSSIAAALCPDGNAPLTAVNLQCPNPLTQTYNATVGGCCTNIGSNAFVSCQDPTFSSGPCVNSLCPNVGYACDTALNECCPQVNYNATQPLGPGIAGMCPVSSVIVFNGVNLNPTTGADDGECFPVSGIPGICADTAQAGPCNPDGSCPTGYTCFTLGQVCCPTVTSYRRIRPQLNYGRPLNSYMPPRHGDNFYPDAFTSTCADGSISAGPCMNGLCGIGLECHGGQCCPPQPKKEKPALTSICPNRQTAVSGCFPDGSCGTGFECVKSMNLCCPPGGNEIAPAQPIFPPPRPSGFSARPIGARCMMDGECVGHADGLSLCYAGVCQCSPIAYTQGIACVRRKALSLQDAPMDDKIETKA